MANTKKVTNVNKVENEVNTEDTDINTNKELENETEIDDEIECYNENNADGKITVFNIAPWDTSFRKIDAQEDAMIPANGSLRLTRSEFISQARNGNKLIKGIDEFGNHATLYTTDKIVLNELEFNNQVIVTKDVVQKIFNISSLSSFEKELTKTFVTRAEKVSLVKYIKDLKINDYTKIMLAVNKFGLTMN